MKARLLILFAIVLATASLVFVTNSARKDRILAADSPSTAHPPHVADGNLPAYRWPVGTCRMYQFRNCTTLAQAADNQPSADDHPNGVEVTGTLAARVLKHERGAIYMGMQLSPVSVTVGGARSEALETLLQNTVPVGAFLPTGRLTQIIVPDQLAKADKDFLMQVFDLDMALPEAQPQGNAWSLQEEDAAGTYEAHFRLLEKSRIEKQKSRYLKLAAEGYQVDVKHSQWNGQVGGEFWLKSLKGEEVLSYKAGSTWGATSTIRVELDLLPESSVAAGDTLIMQLDTALPLADLLAAGTLQAELAKYNEGGAWEAEQTRSRREKFRNMPFVNVRDKLAHAFANMREHADTVAAIHELRDWLLANPEQAMAVAESVKTRLSDGLTARFIHALELAGENPESQDALAAILADNSVDSGVRLQAAVACGGLEHLKSAALGDALWKTAFVADSDNVKVMEIGDSSLLALGALARQDPELAGVLSSELAPYIHTNSEVHPRDIVTAVRTLQNANASDPVLIADIESLAKSHSAPAVRAAAVRFFEQREPNAHELVLDALNDPAEQVQIAALRTLESAAEMSTESVDRLIEKLQDAEAPETVRGQIALALGNLGTNHPSASAALALQRTTATSSLRDTIDAALSAAAE